MDCIDTCIETYTEKYAVRYAGSLWNNIMRVNRHANRASNYMHKCDIVALPIPIFLCLVVKRHQFPFSAQGHTRKASRNPFKWATRTIKTGGFPFCVTSIPLC